MKPKNSAMITEDKVTEIFCIADDFCKVFDAQMVKNTFKAERKLKSNMKSIFVELTLSYPNSWDKPKENVVFPPK